MSIQIQETISFLLYNQLLLLSSCTLGLLNIIHSRAVERIASGAYIYVVLTDPLDRTASRDLDLFGKFAGSRSKRLDLPHKVHTLDDLACKYM